MRKQDWSLREDGAKARYRARLRILSDITSFALTNSYPPDDRRWGGLHTFRPGNYGKDILPGDLVVLKSAPASKWYLSWFIEKDPTKEIFVLESIEDGHLCNWTNVGLSYYDREVVARFPEWRWTDRQFEFNDRWYKTVRQIDGSYYRPNNVRFNAENVSFSIRTRWNFGEKSEPDPIILLNWRKVRMKNMKEAYLSLVTAAEARDKK